MAIPYSMIARGQVILCSYQHDPSVCTFDALAKALLLNISTANDTRRTYSPDGYMEFYIIVENGLIFMACSEADARPLQPFGFLSEVRQRLEQSGLLAKAPSAISNAFNKRFRKVLQKLMSRINITKDIEGVEEKTERTRACVAKLRVRNVQLEDTERSTERMLRKSRDMQEEAAALLTGPWWADWRVGVLAGGVTAAAIYVIVTRPVLTPPSVLITTDDIVQQVTTLLQPQGG